MTKVIVQHQVADYDRWYPLFIEHGDVRRQYGATGHSINRGVPDGNSVMIVNEFATLEGAQGFMTDPSLPDVMARAGVEGRPQVWLLDEAETSRY